MDRPKTCSRSCRISGEADYPMLKTSRVQGVNRVAGPYEAMFGM
ncbi:hypothetical protein [Streptomyces avermitilis]|nr:hypothetical protein [Streptomyces avermitilis]